LDLSVPNKEDQRLLAQFFGSTLIPDNRYQRALVLEGPGSNGKSVVAEVCGAMHKKTATINLDDLTGFSKHELLTASMVIVPETPKRNINEQELKKIISGDKIVIAQKHKDQFSHNPKAKILIACNSFPKIEDESNGLWRRLMLMKFNQVIDKGQEVRNLEKLIIEKEMNIVIDWALAGLQDLLKSGDFVIPSHIEENKELEKKNSKNPLEFLDDMYVEMSDEFTLAKDTLYNKYKIYCQDKGLSIFGEVQFWKIVKQKFPKFEVIQKRESAGRKRYCNLFFDFSQADEDPAIEELTNKMSLEQELEMIERSFASKTISINEYANGIKRAYEKHSKLPQYS
jgi:putative DNA primase/helicase